MNQVQYNPIQPQDAPIAQHGVDLIQLIGGVALVAIGIFVTGLLWVGQLLLVGVGLFCLASWAFRRHEEHIYAQTPALFPTIRTGIRLFPTAHYWNWWGRRPSSVHHVPVDVDNYNLHAPISRGDNNLRVNVGGGNNNHHVTSDEHRRNFNLTRTTDSHSFNNSQNNRVAPGGRHPHS